MSNLYPHAFGLHENIGLTFSLPDLRTPATACRQLAVGATGLSAAATISSVVRRKVRITTTPGVRSCAYDRE
jgi:hypothetical protein